jgi:hypothetical protein
MSEPVTIQADLDHPDRVLAGLTARQVAILAATALLVYSGWVVASPWVPTLWFLMLAVPFAVGGVALALFRRDGISLDRLAGAALLYRLRPRHLTGPPRPAGDPVPSWLQERTEPLLGDPDPEGGQFRGGRVGRLALPVRGVEDLAAGGVGVLDLGSHGLAVLAAASPVPFALRAPDDQRSLLDCFAHLLLSADGPMQILVRALALDLRAVLGDLAHAATTLAHPALAAAAAGHHDYLAELANTHDLLTRQVVLVLRDPTPTSSSARAAVARERLLARLGDARRALGPARISLTPLSPTEAEAVLASAVDPDQPPQPATHPADPSFAIGLAGTGRSNLWAATQHSGQHDQPAATGWTGWADGETGHADRWLPELVRVAPRRIEVGDSWAASLAIVGYPHQTHPGWLQPLLSYPARVDVCLHIDPVPTETATRRLRQQLARLESARYLDADKGRLSDPRADTAAQDAHTLSARLARAETRLHRVGLYLTVHADTEAELTDLLDTIRSLASSMLLDARPTTYRALQAWATTLPLGIDCLAQRRVMDTDAVASTFPFSSPDLPAADPITAAPGSGVFYGHNLSSGSLVIHDRFTAPNHNSVILATSGAGKSYLTKLELLRSLYRGIEVIVIDPEDEYARLADAVGGTHLRLGAPGVRINPLDLPHTDPGDLSTTGGSSVWRGASGTSGPDVLTRRALYLHTVLGVLLGELTAHERVLADQAIHRCYTGAGITLDPATWTRPAPLLADLATTLRELGEPGAISLADRLIPYSSGSFSSLFNGPTTTAPVGHLVVFSLKDLPDELRGIGTLLALDATWRTVADPTHRRPRLVVVDEAWLLLQHPAGAAFLLRLGKSARKHWAGLTLVTQDAADVLATDLGRSVVSNAATHILLRTAAQAAAAITTEFGLSPPEQQFLTSAATGSGLLITHTGHHIPFTAHASTAEDALVTSDPAQLAATPTHADDPQLPHPSPDEPTSPMTPSWKQDGPDPL